MVRGLMSDAEWAFFDLFIRGVRARNGRQGADHRRVLDGVFWIARTGSPWRDLPEEFGKWSSVYRQFRRWTLAGLWETILEALNEGAAELDTPARSLADDRQHRRPSAPACGRRKGGTPRQGIGRSKGGQTTKIHLRTNGWGLPMRADKGYDADRIRAWAEDRDAIPVIPMRRNRKARAGVDKSLYALRNLVERCFGKLKNSRRVATRYDKTAASFLAFVDIACIRLWTRRFVNTA